MTPYLEGDTSSKADHFGIFVKFQGCSRHCNSNVAATLPWGMAIASKWLAARFNKSGKPNQTGRLRRTKTFDTQTGRKVGGSWTWICFFGDFFYGLGSHRIHHHFSPPFWDNMFFELISKHLLKQIQELQLVIIFVTLPNSWGTKIQMAPSICCIFIR